MNEIHRTVLDVPAEAAGDRLDVFLAAHLGSRAAAARAVDEGALVDGRTRPKSYRLEGGERVELPAAEEPAPESESTGPRPTIAWQDEHLAVVDKPAGLVVHPGAGRASGTLVDLLAGTVAGGEPGRPGIVHRLDRDTSGLMVVARSEEAHSRLSDLVRKRALERTYTALVRGVPASRTGRIEAPIGRDRDDPIRFSLDTDTPREAITHFELIERIGGSALLSVTLETGRTHQIRVHLARDRPAGRRRSRLRRARIRASGVSSCTPRDSPSRIRSAASESTSPRRSPRTSPSTWQPSVTRRLRVP